MNKGQIFQQSRLRSNAWRRTRCHPAVTLEEVTLGVLDAVDAALSQEPFGGLMEKCALPLRRLEEPMNIHRQRRIEEMYKHLGN